MPQLNPTSPQKSPQSPQKWLLPALGIMTGIALFLGILLLTKACDNKAEEEVIKQYEPSEVKQPTSYKECPDSKHPHMIDLGLPSGTKWACCNVGSANSPEYDGDYFAWGETSEKRDYTWKTYELCSGKKTTCFNLDTGISGTEYDVAQVVWGDKWQMPTKRQIQELLDNCESEWVLVNKQKGRKFYGPNGGSIFLPKTTYRERESIMLGDDGRYWSGSQSTDSKHCAYYLYIDPKETNIYDYDRYYGFVVRPVAK